MNKKSNKGRHDAWNDVRNGKKLKLNGEKKNVAKSTFTSKHTKC